MSRKHFIDLADTIVDMTFAFNEYDRQSIINGLVKFCKRNGQNFDEHAFRYYIEQKLK